MSDFLTMSDADFMAEGAAKLAAAQAQVAEVQDEPAVVDADAGQPAEVADHPATEEAVADESVPTVPGDGGEATETDEEAEAAEAGRAAPEAAAHADDAVEVVEDDAPDAPGEKPVKKPAAADTSVDGLPEGAQRIFQTFRANGRDMQVKSVDEAIRLMQMGADYSQKRAADKKNRGYVRVLEQNGLLDHEKLAFAVDLINGKPEAIGKLLKDSKVDVHDIDEAQVAAYRSQSKAPSEKSLDLEEVVSEIQGSAHFKRLASEMSNWDEQSQALLGNHPQALKQLTEQMESGVYDTIMDEVNRQQVLGGLVGVPLMEAYNQIGQDMAQAGKFNAKPAPAGPVKKLVTPGKKASEPSKATEERRRAAAPSKGVTTATEETKKVDFLNMKDEDFLKYTTR